MRPFETARSRRRNPGGGPAAVLYRGFAREIYNIQGIKSMKGLIEKHGKNRRR